MSTFGARSRVAGYGVSDLHQSVVEDLVVALRLVHHADAVHDRGVAPAAEVLADVGQRAVAELAREPDGNVACLHEALVALVAHEARVVDVVVLLDGLLDVLDGDGAHGARPALLGERADLVPADLGASPLGRGGGEEASLAEALDDADVGAGELGHVAHRVSRHGPRERGHVLALRVLAHALAEGLDETKLELVARDLDRRREARAQAARHALVEAVLAHAELRRGPVGGEHDLLAVADELVEAGWVATTDGLLDRYDNEITVVLKNTNPAFKMDGTDISVISKSQGWDIGKQKVNIVENTITVTIEADWSLAERDDTVDLDLRDFELTYASAGGDYWTVKETKATVVPGEYTTVTLTRNDDGASKDGIIVVTFTDGENVITDEVSVNQGDKTLIATILPTDWASYTVSTAWKA